MMNRNTAITIGVATGVAVIGYLVFRKQINKFLKKNLGGYSWFEEGLEWYRNSNNKKIIDTLHPKAKDRYLEYFSWVEKNTDWTPILTSGYRSFESQDKLYKDGKTTAKAGFSKHNYGFALDMNFRNKKSGKELKMATSKNDWLASGLPQQAKKMGFEWGGDYSGYYDPVHLELQIGKSMQEMYALAQQGKVDKNGYVKL